MLFFLSFVVVSLFATPSVIREIGRCCCCCISSRSNKVHNSDSFDSAFPSQSNLTECLDDCLSSAYTHSIRPLSVPRSIATDSNSDTKSELSAISGPSADYRRFPYGKKKNFTMNTAWYVALHSVLKSQQTR